MTKINKIFLTIVLTAFVALSTCIVVSAQAPNYEFEYSTGTDLNGYTNGFLYFCDVNTNDVILIFNQVYDISNNTPVTALNVILTENYYDWFYTEDGIVDIMQHKFDCYGYLIKNTITGNLYDGACVVKNEDIYDCFLGYCGYMLYNNVAYTEIEIYNSIENAQSIQFDYWENRIQNAKDVAFDNGFAEGQQTGLQVGYSNGYNDGYNDAISDSDAYLEGLFAVFDAPFVFLENLGSFEVFGITIIDVVTFLLIICFALFIYKVIRRFLPI